MSGARSGFAAVIRSLAEGFVRSLVLVVLTGLAPLGWVFAGAGFFALTGSIAGALGCALGVVGVSLLLLARPMCAATRSLVARWTGTELPAAYRPVVPVTRMATGYWWNGYDYQRSRWLSGCRQWVRQRTRDPASLRDMLWMLIAPLTVGVAAALPLALIAGGIGSAVPLSSVGAVVAAGAGVALLPVCWRPAEPMARRFLGPSVVELLTTRIASLVQGRADLTYTQEAELHRIERNLHDGAQARLVAIGLTLGAAESLVDTDATEAKALLRQAKETSLVALRELRELVHGIVPPVLLERGLVDAVRALALDAPIPAVVHSTLDDRLEMPVESALYFAAAELVTNAVRHSGGTAIEITIDRTRTGVTVTVTDDGRGGADRGAGSGLTGIENRVSAFDGALHVDSPPGGPTRVTVEVPCSG
ncbi:sensor histidine kinase [Amycolatopsis jejuensis]|uniref:sensor histidine kinase n=1 Tax=Amycolatopsis jejuensis TaxID=330084 RepID=UPI00068E6601|nr:histidine kinase [Amycolatopsis jejuensis]